MHRWLENEKGELHCLTCDGEPKPDTGKWVDVENKHNDTCTCKYCGTWVNVGILQDKKA